MKNIFLTLAVAAMAFAACEGDEDTPRDLTIRATSVTGNTTDVVTVKAEDPISGAVIATGAFTDNGFTVTLPTTFSAETIAALPIMDKFFEAYYGDEMDYNISAPDTRYFMITFNAYDSSNIKIGNIKEESASDQINYWYVDRDVTVTGFSTGYITFAYDWTFKKGWNRIVYIFSHVEGHTTITSTSPVPAETGMEWNFTPVNPL